jgi:hypothetical protein
LIATDNIARIGLAIDHQGNGYRWLLPMAMSEPALLNAALAVAASHHSRWQQSTNNDALKYLRASCLNLKQRLVDRKLVHSNVTLASMLLLATYEVLCPFHSLSVFFSLPDHEIPRFLQVPIAGKGIS